MTNVDLAIKNQGQAKVIIYIRWARVPDAACQVLLKSVQQFKSRRFFKVFTIYGHGSHLGHVIVYINFDFPF